MEEKHSNKVQGVKRRKKRVSKKSKRSWRKHTDIKDIEDHLDEVRREERQGGVISLKQNDQLFFVDNDTTENEQDTKANKKKTQKSTRSNAMVFQEPYIKPVVGRKRKIKEQKTKKESSSDDLSDEEITVLLPAKQKTKSPYDLWSSNDQKHRLTDADEHFLRTTKKLPAKQPKTAYKVRGKAPAVPVCHPGASYNPTFEDHQSLLATAFEIEIIKEKEIQKIQKQLQLPPEEELAKLPTWEEEMSQGLFDDESKTNHEYQECSEDEEEVLPFSKTRSRKTSKEKRKVKKKRQEKQTAHVLRKTKAKENDVFRVKSIKKEIHQAVEKSKQRQAKKLKKEKETSLKPQRLGKQKFEEMNVEIQLTDELSGSLRRLKAEGNLFEDRYKSLQRRNIIEPRKPIAPHRKYALKEYQKRSFKNYDLQEKLLC